MIKYAIRQVLSALNIFICHSNKKQVAIFKKVVGYDPDIAFPCRYHDKMLWRKIFDHNPLFITFCDKLATKDYVREKGVEIRMPQTLWVGDSVLKIPSVLLHNKVVIKCNHGCNFNFFWQPGKTSLEEVDRISKIWLSETYGEWYMEWGYLGVPRKIFVEEFVEVSGNLADINVRCAGGLAILVSVIVNNKSDRMAFGYFNPDGSRSELDSIANHSFYNSGILPMDYVVPPSFHDAVRCAELLSLGVDYARYDFMTNGSDLFAGEITVYPAAGVSPATPHGVMGSDTMVEGEWDLRGSWFLSTPQKGWRRVYANLLKLAI
jgi:hypothetical protein